MTVTDEESSQPQTVSQADNVALHHMTQRTTLSQLSRCWMAGQMDGKYESTGRVYFTSGLSPTLTAAYAESHVAKIITKDGKDESFRDNLLQ